MLALIYIGSASRIFVSSCSYIGSTYCEKTDRCDDAPVLRACETLDGVARKAGLGDGAAALSVELLRRHCVRYCGLSDTALVSSCSKVYAAVAYGVIRWW